MLFFEKGCNVAQNRCPGNTAFGVGHWHDLGQTKSDIEFWFIYEIAWTVKLKCWMYLSGSVA